jgi:hypothetical protein
VTDEDADLDKRPFARIAKAFEGLRAVFRPMYAGANMGHPSRTIGLGEETKSDGCIG